MCLLVPWSASRGDYLGKSAAQWEREFSTARDVSAKRGAAFALGKLGIQAIPALPALTRCLESENEDEGVRETAAFSIGQIVPRGSANDNLVKVLCKLAAGKSEDDRATRSAIVALGSCGSDTAEVRAALDKALGNTSPAVRQNSAWALGEICLKSDDPPVSALRRALASKETDRLVKRDAALAFAKIVTPPPVVGGEAEQKQEQERLKKVREQSRAALAELLVCAGNDYVELKKAAVGALVNLVNSDDDKARPILAAACGKTEDIAVRFNAAQALSAIGGPGSDAAVPVLQEVLRNKKGDPDWRQNAVLAFRNLGPVGAAALPDLLEALASDSDIKVRYNAAVALGGWKADSNQIVPALVQRVLASEENTDVRVAAAMSLQSLGSCEQAVAAIPQLVNVVTNAEQPPRIRERVLWALRVHQGGLAKHEEVFVALKNILAEPGLRDGNSGGKMLRYDAAYLLAAYKQSKAPDEVFPVLNDFLQDKGIRIFTGLTTDASRVAEGGASKSVVAEQGGEDGRIMAIDALNKIGAQRVKRQADVIQSLRAMRDSDPAIESKLREATVKVLKDCGVK
jgi:HEAT repeat protein